MTLREKPSRTAPLAETANRGTRKLAAKEKPLAKPKAGVPRSPSLSSSASASASNSRRSAAADMSEPLKMKHLVERTGVPRQVIHFYIQQGLLPEGHKTGRNMAYYDETHVERIELVRKLQHERFLPLKVIKAMLDQTEEAFSPAQKRLLSEVKEHLPGSSVLLPDEVTVDADALAKARGIAEEDLDELAESGFIVLHKSKSGYRTISSRDAWLIDLWGEFRAVGLTKKLGFTPQDLAIFEDFVSQLFRAEVRMLTERVAHLPPQKLATMVERAMPLVNTLITRWHMGKAHAIFATLGEPK